LYNCVQTRVADHCRETAGHSSARVMSCYGLDWTQSPRRSRQLLETLVQLNYLRRFFCFVLLQSQ